MEPALSLLNCFPHNKKTTEYSLVKLNKHADSTAKPTKPKKGALIYSKVLMVWIKKNK